ncbi:MAG: tripartite tricarboxylate transporter substrate-binding protein [Actinomycetota bacterium]|nr:tripartite tricarboxylate transporter substrate-binding protein [Actinomycetota bacterium]
MKHSKKIALTAASVGILALAGCAGGGSGAGGGTGGGGNGDAALQEVSIIVPADPGGGWDQTGRAMAQVLTDEGILESAPVTNIGGAGGTVGLASLANESDPGTLMVMGLVMVGAVETNAAAVRLEDTTPIARLTEEPLIVVVPADSPYQDLGDLVDDIVERGQEVTVTGGSAGGADHILAGLVLSEAGLSAEDLRNNLNYIPNSGGGEAVSLILGNNVAAGISGVGEFAEHVEAGDMRALAVSSEEPVERFPDVPTIADAGYDVTLTNWRGVIAPGGIDDAQREELTRVVTEMHDSAAWQEELTTRGWDDAFLTGDEFDSFLEANIAEVTETLRNIGLIQ